MQTEDNTMNNITMNNELRSQLAKLGWNPDKVVWGKKLGGSPSHLTLLLPNGKERTEFSPITTVTAGDQVAVVRWG
jgi:hypothetical protein